MLEQLNEADNTYIRQKQMQIFSNLEHYTTWSYKIKMNILVLIFSLTELVQYILVEALKCLCV